jgi:thiol-disulfide isomerase/thioredoxin
MTLVARQVLVGALLLCAPLALAVEIGSPAAALEITQWIKGEPQTIAAGDKIYVVEFWATWCIPCQQSIPHLTMLQKKYKDKGVVFIGISDEDAETVGPFVQEKGPQMEYAVALDKNRATSDAYMMAYNQENIPTAFVIDKQARVIWVGHPMSELDEIIQGVVDGTYTVEVAKQREARKLEIQASLLGLASAMQNEDKEKLHSEAEGILAKYPEEAELLDNIAWMLLTHRNESLRNSALALRIAKAALVASKEKNISVLDTYARALFDTGDVKGAIAAQEKAVAAAPTEQAKEYLAKTLQTYQAAAPQ